MSLQGMKLSLWDSYGLADCEHGAGNISEDSHRRWHLNVTLKANEQPQERSADTLKVDVVGIDLA